MTDRHRWRVRLAWFSAALLARLAAPAAETEEDLARLLAASDVLSAAPSEMRAELRVSTGSNEVGKPIELWRKGDRLALVRFLAPEDLGRFVIRRDGTFYLLKPDGRPAVRLSPALAPAGGAALDDLLALRPARDYVIAASASSDGQLIFDLVAAADVADVPRLRWVVDRATLRPVRAELRDERDRVTRMFEFKAWHPRRRLEPAAIVAKDLARGGRPLAVEIVSIEAREVPVALFDLTDGSERARLPPPAATASP